MNRARVTALLVRVCAAVALTALLLALAEVGAFAVLRWREHGARQAKNPRGALSVYQGQPWAPTYWREHGEAIAWPATYHPYVVWRMPPYRGQTIVIDGEGRRRTEHSRCDGDAYTIYVLGGSTVWGYGAPDWATIPSLLAERYVKAGRTVCVRNYGELGWSSTQGLIALMLELKRGPRRPDLVVFYEGCNVVLNPYQEGRVDVHGNFAQISGWLEQPRVGRARGFGYLGRSNIATVLGRLLAKWRGAQGESPGAADVDRLVPEIVQDYLTTMDVLDALATAYGFRYEMIWQPVAFVGAKRLTAEEEWAVSPPAGASLGRLPDLYRKTYARVREIRRPHLHDLAGMLDGRSETVYVTMCHLSPEGNRLVAEQIYEVVERPPR